MVQSRKLKYHLQFFTLKVTTNRLTVSFQILCVFVLFMWVNVATANF